MRKTGLFLLIEGILSICLAFIMFYIVKSQNSLELLFMPFDWIGNTLRWLSLSSSVGNIISLVCYIALSVTPIIYVITIRRKEGFQKVDLFLIALSIYLFLMLYEFINQGLMLNHVPQVSNDTFVLPIIKLALAIIFYSLLLGYLIIRMLGALVKENIGDRMQFLCRGLQKILLALAAVYTLFIGYFVTFQMFSSLNHHAVKASTNPPYFSPTTFSSNVMLDQFMVVLTYLLQCLPIVYSIFILINGIKLLKVMTSHHMKEEEYIAANELSNISKKAVYVTVFSNLCLNLIQLLLMNHLSGTSFELEIILSPLIIAFGAMILSSYFKETKELQEDNEMII
jgi:hypothetical protein